MKNVNEMNYCSLKMDKENHGNLCKKRMQGGVFLIPSFHLLTFGDQSLKMFEKVTYMYIYMHLFLDYSILAYTKILLWTKHICLSTYISVFCIYVCTSTCVFAGKGAVELLPRSYMLTNILGKFYDCFF